MKAGTLEAALRGAVGNAGWTTVVSWDDEAKGMTYVTLGMSYRDLAIAVEERKLHIPSPATSLRRPPMLRGATGFPFKRR